jgi:hypothetical protein
MPPRWFMFALSAAHILLILILMLAFVTAVAYVIGGICWLILAIV